MGELKKTYDRIAEDWNQDHLNDTWWKAHIDDLITQLPLGGTVLDVGCGAGHKSLYFSERGFKVKGIDFSEKMIEIAKRQVLSADFEVRDMYDLDAISETFDCVFVCASLLHIPKKDVPGILRACRQRLAENGILFIAVKEQWEGQSDERVETEDDYGYQYRRFFSYFTLPQLERLLSDADMKVVQSDITTAGNTRWIRVFAKKSER